MPAAERPAGSNRRKPIPLNELLSEPTSTGTTGTGERRRRTPRPVQHPPGAPLDTRTAMHRVSNVKRQQGINFDLDLLEYAREVVTLMGRRHPEEAGSESLAALVDQALREKITRWERKYADGEALPPL